MEIGSIGCRRFWCGRHALHQKGVHRDEQICVCIIAVNLVAGMIQQEYLSLFPSLYRSIIERSGLIHVNDFVFRPMKSGTRVP